MKRTTALPAVIAMALAACDTMNRPITNGDFDPLRPPGSQATTVTNIGPAFKAGQFVRAVMDNTAFFTSKPKGDTDANKLLPRGTSMKVISPGESYIKVELDSGEVGWVPTVMVEDPNAVTQPQAYPGVNPGEYQVYPPLGGFAAPMPPVTPAEPPPDGAIPTVIDPEAPTSNEPVPPVTVPGDALPATPQVEAPATPHTPAPLPPNGEADDGQ